MTLILSHGLGSHGLGSYGLGSHGLGSLSHCYHALSKNFKFYKTVIQAFLESVTSGHVEEPILKSHYVKVLRLIFLLSSACVGLFFDQMASIISLNYNKESYIK